MNRAWLLQLLSKAECSKLVSDTLILPGVKTKCLESPVPVLRPHWAGELGQKPGWGEASPPPLLEEAPFGGKKAGEATRPDSVGEGSLWQTPGTSAEN